MTDHVVSSKLRKMRTFNSYEGELSSQFQTFITNKSPESEDISIISYILYKLNIKPESQREFRIFYLYSEALDLKRKHPNLRRVDMAFWAYKRLL